MRPGLRPSGPPMLIPPASRSYTSVTPARERLRPGGVSSGLPGPGMGGSRRNIMSRLSGLTGGLVLIAWGFAIGQEVIQPTTVTATPAGPTAELRRVSQILGSSVRLQDGSGSGRVEDIVLS